MWGNLVRPAALAIYLLANNNNNITGKTFSTNALWTPGDYNTRSSTYPTGDAYVRFEFQDVTSGPYDSNDYWWSAGANSLDLNIASSGALAVSLANCSLWSNQAGKSACDTTAPWTDWTGVTITVSPAQGFANAMKNVKETGLSVVGQFEKQGQ